MSDSELIVAILAAFALLLSFLRNDAKAYTRGYQHGYKDANNWWTSAEREVDAARQQIWREEPKRGMEQQ